MADNKWFGFELPWSKNKKKPKKSFVPEDDGSVEGTAQLVSYGDIPLPGFAVHAVNLQTNIKNVRELIERYREMSLTPEIKEALQDIVNDAIVTQESMDSDTQNIEIILDEIDLPPNTKEKIIREFNEVLTLLKFQSQGQRIFHKWYVDGRIYYHIIIDDKNKKAGIQELRYVDPRFIQKIQEVEKEKNPEGQEFVKHTKEYYVYEPKFGDSSMSAPYAPVPQPKGQIRIEPDAIAYNHSGIVDSKINVVLGHLHPAIKPLNMLRRTEDSLVVYRLSRAPERRLFRIYTGSMPKQKAEKYLREQMQRYKNKSVYDADTGEIRDDRRLMAINEDFWFPRGDDGKESDITQLPGGQNLGKLEDLEYFEKKLYKSLNIPVSRIETGDRFNMGRPDEITRDELKYYKFIQSVQSQFSKLFLILLRTQLSLKNILSEEEWDEIENHVKFVFAKDSHFRLLKEMEILRIKLSVLNDAHLFTRADNGGYLSKEWIKKRILGFTDEDIKKIQEQRKKESAEPPIMSQFELFQMSRETDVNVEHHFSPDRIQSLDRKRRDITHGSKSTVAKDLEYMDKQKQGVDDKSKPEVRTDPKGVEQ